jgi:hypothetical protein
MTDVGLSTRAQLHVALCGSCRPVVYSYGREVREAIEGKPLPDELASKIRARLCKAGAALFDEIMGVVHVAG